MRSTTLQVPGATLYYEVRGTGPVLLLICGGVYDAAGYAGLADSLADRYTTVTYDRRGNSRSPLDGPAAPQHIEVHADDASRLLEAVGAEGPALVFGNSSGAIIGLDLISRHPEQVSVLVAHEPPLFSLLPDREHWDSVIGQVEAAFAENGPGAAMGILGAALAMDSAERVPGGGQAPVEPDAETVAMLARLDANMVFFIGYEVPSFHRCRLDLDALQAVSDRIAPAAGRDSKGQPPYEVAASLADLLGRPLRLFPGDHGGFGLLGDQFAQQLDAVLANPAG